MKKKILLPLFVAAFLVGMSSCEKENNHQNCDENNQENEVAMSPEEFEEGIMDAFDAMEVLGGDESTALYMDDEGIPAFLDMEPFNVNDFAGKKEGPCQLRGENELHVKQKTALKEAWESYMKCKHESSAHLRKTYHEIHVKMEKARAELHRALKAGKITPEQYREKMAKLRHQFRSIMKERGAAHQQAMRKCYGEYLAHVKHTLTREQYALFIRCHKGHLPEKRKEHPRKRKEHEKERK